MNHPELEGRSAAISIRQLKLFESVGRLSSVRKTSEECNLSQPAVTQALGKLEQQIGVSLLDRRAMGSYLNEYGVIFHRRVSRMFSQIEHALVEFGIPGGATAAAGIAKRISRSQVRSLVAILDCGSFIQAAETLGLSQPSLNRAARDLENNLRKPLFYRTAAGFVATQAGIVFGRRIKLATQEIEWGINEVEAAKGSGATKIVIGAMPFGGSVLLASVLDQFLAAHPDADVRILNGSASEMLRSLRAGDIDFNVGLLQQTVGDDLANHALARTPYAVVARRGHHLHRAGPVSIDDLLRHDWVVGTEGSSRRICFERLFTGKNVPNAPIATCALTVIRQLLAGSDRLTLMTSYELLHEDSRIAAVPFGPIEPAPEIGITTRANWLPTRLHTDFIDLLRQQMTEAGLAEQMPVEAAPRKVMAMGLA